MELKTGPRSSCNPTHRPDRNAPLIPKVKPLTIPVTIGDTIVQALLDTGSTQCIISNNFFQKLKLNKKTMLNIKPVTNQATTANGSKIHFKQEVPLHFKIEYLSWSFPFLVANRLPIDMIIGLNFIQYSDMVINAAQREITFPFDSTFLITNEIDNQQDLDDTIDQPTFGEYLKPNQIKQFQEILDRFPHTVTTEVGRTNLIEYEIKLNSDKPVKSRPYYYAPPKMEQLRQHVQDLLSKQIIRPSKSPYSSPAFLVSKRNSDKTRMVVNYKEINKIMDIPSWPVETVETAFQYLGDASVYSVLDLVSAYNQLPLAEASKKYTAFVTPTGSYEYNYIPFGIASGSMILSELMDKIFSDIKYKYIYTYFDDLVVYSKSIQEHKAHLEEVLTRLNQAGLTVNPGKMVIASHKIEFLGHVFENSKVSLNPQRTKPIDDFPPPKNVKQLAKFLGLCSFYSRFIPSFSQICIPLNNLKRKNAIWRWGTQEQEAFETLKKALVSEPVLRLPDFQKEFILHTDASGLALGAVLSQKVNGHLAPVAYASRTLNRHEKNYSAFELEALAVVFGLTKFRQYLEHRPFELYTDNSALSYILNHPRQVGKLARWITLINSFKFTVFHVRGSDNAVADALSRLFDENPVTETRQPTIKLPDNSTTPQSTFLLLTSLPEIFKDIITHQKQDDTLRKIRNSLATNKAPPNYKLVDNILVYQLPNQKAPRVVIPQNLFDMLFKFYHESALGAHMGIKKTLFKINKIFYAPKLSDYITDRVRSCDSCQRSKQAQNTKFGFLASDYATRPFQNVFCDYIGPLPRTKKGFKWLLVVIDSFSKYTVMLPSKNATAATTTNLLEKGLFSYFGHPNQLVTDRGGCFKSDHFKQFCMDLGIKHVKTSPYYPKPSHAERINKNIGVALRIFHSVRNDEWDQNLHLFQIAFNSAKHNSTGTSPAELFLGYPLVTPLENHWNLDNLIQTDNVGNLELKWQQAITNLHSAREKVRDRYNKDRLPNPFRVNDRVMFRKVNLSNAAKNVSKKLQPLWSRQLIINRFTSPVTVELKCPKSGKIIRTAHISHLKKYNLFNSA